MLSVLSPAGAELPAEQHGSGDGGRSEPLAHLVERGIESAVVLTFQRQ